MNSLLRMIHFSTAENNSAGRHFSMEGYNWACSQFSRHLVAAGEVNSSAFPGAGHSNCLLGAVNKMACPWYFRKVDDRWVLDPAAQVYKQAVLS